MQQLTSRCLFVCLLAVAPARAVLIDFTSRTDFATQTTLASGLPTANGVNFTSTALCPTTASTNGNPAGCAPNAGWSEWASSTNPRTVAFGNVPGFSMEGYFGGTSNTPRLYLYSSNYVQPIRGALTYGIPVMSTRNIADNANTSALKVRLNVPATTNSFAIDLWNGCNTNTGTSGCDPGDNHVGSIRVTTSNGDFKIVNTTDPSPTASGEATFYGAKSDTPISWIELSLPTLDQAGNPNFGSVVFTNIAFGVLGEVPETSTWVLAAIGLSLLALRRRVS